MAYGCSSDRRGLRLNPERKLIANRNDQISDRRFRSNRTAPNLMSRDLKEAKRRPLLRNAVRTNTRRYVSDEGRVARCGRDRRQHQQVQCRANASPRTKSIKRLRLAGEIRLADIGTRLAQYVVRGGAM